ncbi:MAG: 4-hydroxythreonine-4-phosphate dehydrogenase PdxA, partial [Rhodospirillaceae bacterium]
CPLAKVESPAHAIDVYSSALPVLPLERALDVDVALGAPSPDTSAAVVGSIDQAVRLTQRGYASAIVTNPIQKSVLRRDEFPYPGHTEYLGHLAGDVRTVMMLVIEGLRVVPVTVHLPIREVASALTTDDIVTCGRLTASGLQRDFGIAQPRLAVAALNPHAGEKGRFGDEEARIIEPAVKHLKADGLAVQGPLPADTLFHPAAREAFDAVLCMYHDQALIPLKTLDFANGVNVTLGLPFVRTSPDHGTACDIATKGIADPSSFTTALRTAHAMSRSRAGVEPAS